MGNTDRTQISQWIHVERIVGGHQIRVQPEAARLPLAEVIAHVVTLGLFGVDYDAVAQAHRRADGVPVVVARSVPQRATSVGASAEKCLVACAEPPLAQDLSHTLSRCGIAVQAASSAGGAFAEIVGNRPDVVLLTQPIGDEDALSVCRQVRCHPEVQRTPIILIPSKPSRNAVIDGIRAGANDLVVKPVAPGTLLRKVSKALDGVGKSLPPRAREAANAHLAPLLADEAEVKSLGKIDIDKVVRKVDRLAALPAVVERVVGITANDKSGAKDLAAAVQSDPAVSAAILKRANSATYGRVERIFNVQESIVRLGFSLTRSIVIGMSVIRLFPKGQKTVGFDRVEFWRHSLGTAIAARLLAPRVGGGTAAGPLAAEMAFMAGLLHDLGKVVLDQYCPDDFERACLLALRDGIPLRQAEQAVLETDHARVGAAVLASWKFPAPILQAVARHHSIAEADEGLDAETARLCRLVRIADLLAKALGEGHGGDLLLQELSSEEWWANGLGRGLPSGFVRAFDDEVARSRDFLDLAPPPCATRTETRSAVFLHDGLPPVSVLGLTLERLDWRGVPLIDADQALRFPAGSFHAGIVRTTTTERLEAVLTTWRRSPALATVPLVGIVPAGQRFPADMEGVTCISEPYDRFTLERALQ